MRLPRSLIADPADPRHGTVNGYTNCKCRCDECRRANREYAPAKAARERWRRRAGMQPRKRGRTHGLRSTYRAGCRCEACRAVERDYRFEYRQRAS